VPALPPKPVGLAVVPSFAQTLKEGFAFGIGSSVARTAVDRLFAPKDEKQTCSEQQRAYELCVLVEGNESFCIEEKNRYKKCLQLPTDKAIPLEKE
jgi:hypothetical protein